MRKLMAMVLVTAAFTGRVGAGDISFQEVLGSYSEEITSITACGRWDNDVETGFYRVIAVNFLFGGSRLWVQWMRNRDKDGRTRVLHTQSIEEFNDYEAAFLIGDIRCNGDGSVGLTCRFLAADGHSGYIFEFEIKLSKEYGKYSIVKNKTPNKAFDESREASVECLVK